MASSSVERRLQDKVQILEEKKAEAARLEGQKTQLLHQLKTLGAKDIPEGETLLKKLDQEIQEAEADLEKTLDRLEQDYPWE